MGNVGGGRWDLCRWSALIREKMPLLDLSSHVVLEIWTDHVMLVAGLVEETSSRNEEL